MSLPKLVTALPGPNAQAIIARDAKAVSPSYTRGYPLVMARGEGALGRVQASAAAGHVGQRQRLRSQR